jgi:mono/diheme cytochrome c family protein
MSRKSILPFIWRAALLGIAALSGSCLDSDSDDSDDIVYVDQGTEWTNSTRAAFYVGDQGSQLIPYAWLASLKDADGSPFLRDQLGRYGFLPRSDREPNQGLPVGFTVATNAGAVEAGITCAACHTRQITSGGKAYRIDGGPAIVDFESFFNDLDAAVRRTLTDPAARAAFKLDVLGTQSAAGGVALQEDLAAWYVPYHALISGSLPQSNLWGLGRVDALSIIFNRLSGLDIGEPPGYLILENIVAADAPVRFPFLWNAPRQDFTQWPGITPNGNETQGLLRNFGEVLGVFAIFHPKKDPSLPLGYDYLADNTANLPGLQSLEQLVMKIGAPKWPWAVDSALAQKGSTLFTAECAGCHGIQPGIARPPVTDTWSTPVQNVGTDTREWEVVNRIVRTGVMEGALRPDANVPLLRFDLVARVLTTVTQSAITQAYPGTVMAPPAPVRPVGSYESRVMQGIWAAPPYLHNGSVASMAELLKPAAERKRNFQVGPAYDTDTLGLAAEQPEGQRYVRNTDGCSALNSGNSNCGHEFGTTLTAEDKKALLEYLKTL